MSNLRSHCSIFFFALIVAGPVRADLVLETETAELGKKGDFTFSMATQLEWERDGSRSVLTLNQFEYAITDRAEILVEPFFYEWDSPKGAKGFGGLGDLEITPSYMVLLDDPESWVPAAVLAFKLKVPTATNPDIGTGEYDYQPYVIFGKNIDNWVFNANFGYDFVTSVYKGDGLKGQFIYDFSAEYKITDKLSVFAEIFANTSPAVGDKGTFAEAIATEYKFGEHFNAFLSVGYDSDHLFNIRPGFNFEF